MMQKVNWNVLTDICASDSLKTLAGKKSGGQKCLFIDFNNVCDSIGDAAIVKLIEQEYPNNIVYEEVYETWGSGINAFVFGDEILGEGNDFDLNDVIDSLDEWSMIQHPEILEKLELATINKEWEDFTEFYNLDKDDSGLLDKFKDYIYNEEPNASFGYFGVDFSYESCYDFITGKEASNV